MGDMIRLAVVDDHPLFRDGVIHTLSTQDDMVVVGQGETAADAIRLARETSPDVILLDLHLKGDGIKAVGIIARQQPSVNVLMLTVVADEECVMAAMRNGARGYLLKGVSALELLSTVRAVNQRQLYVSPSLAAQILSGRHAGTVQRDPQWNLFGDLTDREHQILSLLSQALSNKEIAAKLELTEKTVKHYLTNILRKLHVRNRVEAALLASRRNPEMGCANGMDRALVSLPGAAE